jgi:hypothetical protein
MNEYMVQKILQKRLVNVRVLNSLVTYKKNTGHKVYDLKFRSDFIEGLLVQY